MKILTTVYLILVLLCVLEAYFCTKFEDEL